MNERVVWRPYFDYEAEERWLNSMAAQGWEMKRYTWCRYVFERGVPGRYTYRLQLLPKAPSANDSKEYLSFLQEADVEVVATYNRWVYARKAAGSEPFELFSDRQSKLLHRKQIATTLVAVSAAQMPLLAVTIQNVASSVRDSAYATVPLLVLHALFVGVLAGVAIRQYGAIRRLERDAIAHE